MGVDHVTAEFAAHKYRDLIAARGGFTFGVFKELVNDIAVQFRKQEGRFYVLLSLTEAEHFRSVMHARHGMPLLPNELMVPRPTTAALWMMSDYDVVLIETTSDFSHEPGSQHGAMVNCYRFLNSDTYYDSVALSILLRILENNSCEQREKWWNDIRACRRRRQIALDGSVPITTLFNTKDEYEYMEFKAVIARVQYGLQERGMLVFDAFRAFNSSNSGLLSCSELYGGLDFLGIPFTPQQIYDLVKKIAIQSEVGTSIFWNFLNIVFSILLRVLCHMKILNEYSNRMKTKWNPEPSVGWVNPILFPFLRS